MSVTRSFAVPSTENHLIELLPSKDRKRLLQVCEPVELALEQILSNHGEPTSHAYFPTSSFISMVTELEGKPALEVGMVGREGMLGAHLALGVSISPLHSVVQGAGTAWRVGVRSFRRELQASAALRTCLDRYLYVLMAQLASSAACLRFHQIGPRLARWLLMSQDRAHAASFHVTHEFLAYMLGVRRVGITSAASLLQKQHLIAYHRGEMRIIDRRRLEAVACSCYSMDCQDYGELLH
jgi:CRP-like cAMP-binding protein